MSEQLPNSSAEYGFRQRCAFFAPKTCKITSIDWCGGKSLMVSFSWNNRTRRVNIAGDCRTRFGKLTPQVRCAIIEAAPKEVTISTSVTSYGNTKKRYLHHINKEELADWLDCVKI